MDKGDIQKAADEFYRLLDVDPAAAVALARGLPDIRLDDGLTTDSLRAAFFVDAAAVMEDLQLVREARAILEVLCAEHPDRLDVRYNLANALSTESKLHPYTGPAWYIDTLPLRFAARATYQEVIDASPNAGLLAEAQANLGNELWRAHRWVEAYDAFQEALVIDPTNAVASTGAVKVLLRARDLGIGDPAIAEAVAARHLRNVAGSRERIRQLAGQAAADDLDRLQGLGLQGGDPPDLSKASPYEQFVAHHRLALATTIEGLDVDLKRWDSLHISSIIETTDAGHGVPPAFAISNAAKAEYLAVRWLCYLALTEESGIPETGSYADTLDYAVYGVRPALMVLAQRASLDVLDKIALLITEYLGLGDKSRTVKFRTRWHHWDKNTIAGWNESLAPEIDGGNRGFVALADVAADLSKEGFLWKKKDLRDAGTHRVIIVHDLGKSPSRESPYVTHVGEGEFGKAVLGTLRLARASLLYTVEAIALCEARKSEGYKFLGSLTVPSHHWVRGEEE
jgi:tetratricopeptide (TPR) repeat protein